MQPALHALCVDLIEAANAAVDAAESGGWEHLREAARRALSAASKLHARSVLLVELDDDAKFIAEVDRAIVREQKSRAAGPIPGDQPLPFEDPPTPPGKRGNPRKGGKK